MTAFPTGIDPAVTSDPGQTLDEADHTNLHNVLSGGMHEVQALLGPKPVTAEPLKTMRQRLLDVEGAVVSTAPISGTSATSLPYTAQPTAVWNAGARTIAFGIPAGVPGKDGQDGTGGGGGAAASGTVSNTKLTPIRAGTIVGLDIAFTAALASVPIILCTPIQDTVGSGSPTTTTGTVSSTVVAARWKTYQGSGAVRTDGSANILYHGQWDTSYDNQRGIVCFPDLKAQFPKGAVATSVKLEFTTGASQQSADQITIHPHSATTPPTTLPDPSNTQYYRYRPTGGLTQGAKFTLDLTSKNWGAKFIDGSYGSLVIGPERNSTGGIDNAQGNYGGVQATTVKLIVAYSVTSEAPVTNIDSVPVDVGVRNVTKSGFRLVVRNSNQSDEKVRVGWAAIL